jgi:hypothetical protein
MPKYGGPTLVFLALLSAVVPAAAQTDGVAEHDVIELPRLAGHTFIPTRRVPDPFIKTFVRSSVGLGKAYDITYPLVDLDTILVLGLTGDVVFANLDFEYQQAINSWLAVRGEFRVVGRLGNGLEALLAQGITAATGFEFGWLFKLFASDRTMLSGTLSLTNRNFTTINLEQFLKDVSAGRPASLVKNTPSIRGGGGVGFAWAISPTVGLTADASAGYGESVDRETDDEKFYEAGIAVDVDLGAPTTVPIGFVLGYQVDSFPEGGTNVTGDVHSFFVKIAYTGEPQFSLSIDMDVALTPLRGQEDTSKNGSTSINLRYYF